MRRRLRVILLSVSLLCTACNSTPVIPTTPPLGPTASPIITLSATAALAPSPTPTSLPAIAATAAPTPTGMAPLPGMIFATTDALWQTGLDGRPVKLIDQVYGIAISPDGDRLLAVENDSAPQALWLIDLKTSQRRNLTENLGRVVCCPVWWPARPGWVLFQSWAPNDIAPDAGYLTAARLAGQQQRVLDSENRSNGLPAPAPDGRMIAYDRHGKAWLYDWDNQPQQFDPEVYGLKNIQQIAGPAWSPDGRQLTWYVGGDFGQGWQVGLAVFDLTARTGRLYHVYSNVGRGGWFDAPVWSPDGHWLAFGAEDQDQAQAGLWVVKVDGQEERLITSEGKRGYSPPVWDPEGRWLAADRTLYEIGTWQMQMLNLPHDAEVIAWVSPTK